MMKFDVSQLAGVPRAIPLAALGMSDAASISGSTVTAAGGVAGPLLGTAAGGAQGFTADQLTAAGLSGAVASFAGDFAAAERKFNLPSGVLAAVAQAESGGRTDAVSKAGAEGLMQLMPATAAGLGVTDPFDPQQAIDGAAQYLSSNLSAFGGSLTKALAAYNAGPGAVRQYDGVPPYAETQNYVRKVTDMLARLS
jgi:soluble lytic murein transglycosylase-like protein